MKIKVRMGDKEYEAEVEELGGNRYRVNIEGRTYDISIETGVPTPTPPQVAPQAVSTKPVASTKPTPTVAPIPKPSIPSPPTPAPTPTPAKGNIINAPISGKVLKVLVKPGDEVNPKSVVITLESMKMELEVYAGRSGRIKEVLVKPGESVRTGQPVAVLE